MSKNIQPIKHLKISHKNQSQSEFFKLSKLLSVQPPLKKHCSDDIACIHCCQCWLNHKKQYQKRLKYFQQKINTLTNENQLLKTCLQKTNKQNVKLKAHQRGAHQIQDLKQKLTKQLKKQIDQEIRLNDILQKQQIEDLKNQLMQVNQQLQTSKVLFSDKLNKLRQYIDQLTLNIRQKEQQIQRLHKQVSNKAKLLLQIYAYKQQVCNLNSRLQVLSLALQQKTSTISAISCSLTHSDTLLLYHKQQLAQKEFQTKTLQSQCSNKQKTIEQITRANTSNVRSLDILETQKGKLGVLLQELKDQLSQTHYGNTLLKLKLDQVQVDARQKAISLSEMRHDLRMIQHSF